MFIVTDGVVIILYAAEQCPDARCMKTYIGSGSDLTSLLGNLWAFSVRILVVGPVQTRRPFQYGS